MYKNYLLLFSLLILNSLSAQYIQKVTNINYYGNNGLNPRNITVFNNKLYFFGTDEKVYVDKLMSSDGTEAGTVALKIIDSAKGYPTLMHLTILNNLLLFDNRNQLWKSDGTSSGTSLLSTLEISSTNYAVMNNKVYFAADITNSNPIKDQLWQTDGTVAGTTLVKTINPTGPSNITSMFVSGGKIYFSASNGVDNSQLWVSDGTTAGTQQIKKINSTGSAYINNFVSYNLKVYFSADDGVNGGQLWETDGTAAGTTKITNINTTGGYGLSPRLFIPFNGKLFFCGMDNGVYYQLYTTDGTAAGTKLIKTEYTPRNGVRGFDPTSMVVHQSKLYIAGYDSLNSVPQLWVSDGTTAGTTRVSTFKLGLYPDKLYSFQNKIVMTGYDTINKTVQLWASDGTAAGTVCPKPPDTWSSYPFYPFEYFVPFNNSLYFLAAYAYFADYQLCRYSETPVGIASCTKNILNAFPNPVKNILHFPIEISLARVSIIDCKGVVLKQEDLFENNSISVQDLSTGMYFYIAEDTKGNKFTGKIVKE